MFKKGPSYKNLENMIDYVPELSDLDIHYRLKDGKSFSDFFDDPVKGALEIAQAYNERFRLESHFHVP